MVIIDSISDYFQSLINSIPGEYSLLVNLFLYTIFIAIYAIFIWKFYKFLASKEIIELNLRQYNYSKYPALEKFLAIILYTIEYLVILPFLVLFWFAILSLFLLLLSQQTAQQILLVSAAIIASTRITAYISEDLSKDLAKILPFTVLATFILRESFFQIDAIFEKVKEIPALFNHILVFIVFIFVVEFILRAFSSIKELFESSKSKEEIQKNSEPPVKN